MTVKERMEIPPQAMPSQEPEVRRHNMREVALGYTAEQARTEATRCLNCKNAPCMAGCPVNIDIPSFLEKTADGDFDGAIAVIRKSSLLPVRRRVSVRRIVLSVRH